MGEAGTATEEVGDLVAMLERVEGRRAAAIALLWTWLERHLIELGSLVEKAPALRRRALAEGPLANIDAEALAAIAAEPPAAAAVVLARMALGMGDAGPALIEEAQSFLGKPVWVSWGGAELARRIGRDEGPPSAQEHPSPSALAPALRVSPVSAEEYGLHVPRLEGPEWELAKAMLAKGLADHEAPLEFHLATLGDRGLSDWWIDPDLSVAALLEERVEPAEQEDAAEAFAAAVAAASANGVLLLPELAATSVSIATISGSLAEIGGDGPALTVVGLYHREPEGEEAAGGTAPFVNEAVVLGPNGGELWRQRKLSYAEGPAGPGEEETVVEHIRLGDSLAIVPSPLGTIAVVICLDAFRRETRERILRSPAQLLLVPSLSPRVHRHRDSLQQLVQGIWGTAFVCNRSAWPKEGQSRWDDTDNRSFCVAQRESRIDLECWREETTFVLRLDG